MKETQELDGDALFNRRDWPLPSPPLDEDEQERHLGASKGLVKHGLTEMGNDDDQENAVSRGRQAGEEPCVSDIDMDDDDDSDSDSDSDISDSDNDKSNASTSRHLSTSTPDYTRNDVSPERPSHRDLTAPQHEAYPEVSPVREGDPLNAPRGHFERPSPLEQPQETVQLGGGGQEGARQEREVRDISTHIPPGPDSPGLPQGAPSTPPLAGVHTTPPRTTVPSNRRSVITGTMQTPPHRRGSTRTSWINTTQLPHNKERVRYSWQSVQDDEPNRPRIHIIKLVSNTATSSAGFPTGEAFGFSISPGGRRIAAFNSARLYVLQTNALPVGISQDFALRRRPLAVEITDEGSCMAILADDHTVNVYDLGLTFRRTRTIKLDFPTTCIALAPTGGLLAAAYEGGVEVFSLAPSALPTDRRAVRSIKMDRLAFSDDGSTLLGTTTRINVSSTVVTSVPVFPAAANGIPTHEELKEAWCTELLHPENIRNSSHATFMRESRAATNDRVFAWNGLEDTFGILSVGDMQYGNVDFPVVISPPLSTCGGLGAAIHSCPAIDEHGDTVAMIVNDRTIRLYIVPPNTDDDTAEIEAHSIDHELDEGYGCPFSEVRWVYSSASWPAPTGNQSGVKGRLIVASPGGVTESGISEESVDDIEGGRIIMFDFDPQFAGQPGQTFSLTLGKSPPQTLEEEQVNDAEQVALVRRRTVNQSKGLSQRPTQLGRAATTYGGRLGRGFSSAQSNNTVLSRPNRSSILSIGSMQSEAARSLPDLAEGNETPEAIEEPYVQGAPRSHASLQRAASNAQRHRFQTLEERQRERISADSHGNFLALPEYTEEPNAPLPSRYRQMAGLDAPAMFNPKKVTTDVNGNIAGSSSSGPYTAPPDVGESFSADSAFQAANAQATASRQNTTERSAASSTTSRQTPTQTSATRSDSRVTFGSPQRGASVTSEHNHQPHGTGAYDSISPSAMSNYSDRGGYNGTASYGNTIPSGANAYNGTYASNHGPTRNGTFDSTSPMPRSLQRAYSNAISPINGPPPGSAGDGRNVISPIGYRPASSQAGSVNGSMARPPQSSSGGSIQEDEPWDLISPVNPPSRYGSQAGNPYRYSASKLNPSGNLPPIRSSSSVRSFATTAGQSTPPSSADGRRMPPHMQAFRQAAAENATSAASLFPPNQPSDHVPVRQNTIKASTVTHPVTAWHPPAPSASSSTPHLQTSGSLRRSHSRKTSLTARSAFASTSKAKKLGFFKKSKRPDPFAPSAYQGLEDSSMMETKSMFTTFTRGEGKCGVM